MTSGDGDQPTVINDGQPRGGLVLDLDPDLGSGIDDAQWEQARMACRANRIRVSPGRWALAPASVLGGKVLALLVTDGTLSRETALAGHASLELFTAGDVLLPLTLGTGAAALGTTVTLTALTELNVLVLGPAFLQAAARWPCLLNNLHQRLVEQQTHATIHGLVLHLPRVEHRILFTLWLLAERCGRVTPEGRLLPLGFTHEALSRITAARRPTVSLALKQLQSDGLLAVAQNGTAILTPAAERTIQALAAVPDGPIIGESITLRPHRGAARPSHRGPQPPVPPRVGQRQIAL